MTDASDERTGEVGGERIAGVAAAAAVAAVAEAAAAASGDPAANLILPSTYRNLTDKLYEKRKLGALEVEAVVRGLLLQGNDNAVRKVIQALTADFVGSTQAAYKKGGMIGLAAASIAVGPSNSQRFLPVLAPPILGCLTDPDPRVRYYALEALFNVVKVARENVLGVFTDIFDASCRLSADLDQGVRNANQLLDRLVKDVVTQAGGAMLDLDRLVPLLSKRIDVTNPNARMFLMSWLSVLNSVPGLDLLHYLPAFLDGLFEFLVDTSRDISSQAAVLLAEFLHDLSQKKRPVLDYGQIVAILIGRCTGAQQPQPQPQQLFLPTSPQSKSPPIQQSQPQQPPLSPQPQTQQQQQQQQQPLTAAQMQATILTSLRWIDQILECARDQVMPHTGSILNAVLPHLSFPSSEVAAAASAVNNKLLRIANNTSAPSTTTSPATAQQSVPISGYINAVIRAASLPDVPPRLAGFTWILLVHTKWPDELFLRLDELLPTLLRALSDPSEDVMSVDLEVLSCLSGSESYFAKVMENLARLFATDRQALRDRAARIVQLLCRFTTAERIFVALAGILEKSDDAEFASETVQTLNLLLLSIPETRPLRLKLKQHSSPELFERLYRAWAHSPASLFSLCLLCQFYAHASELVTLFSEAEVTLGFLLELDQLVQLLESPAFVQLRLQLLEPSKHRDLIKCLYGLLMILPQSSAFSLLKTRLGCASRLAAIHCTKDVGESKLDEEKSAEGGIDTKGLLAHFVALQGRRESQEAAHSHRQHSQEAAHSHRQHVNSVERRKVFSPPLPFETSTGSN